MRDVNGDSYVNQKGNNPQMENIRTVLLKRPPDPPGGGFGFSIKGKDSANGIYVSKVEVSSPADRASIRSGDQLLEVNGISFNGILHQDALKVLKSAKQLQIVLWPAISREPYQRSTPTPPLTSSSSSHPPQKYIWLDRQGRTVSPPPPYHHLTRDHSTTTAARSSSRHTDKHNVRQIELSVDSGQSLGLMIRGGAEYGLGIFVTGVDAGSVAERGGLQMGDQIVEVNDQSFLTVSHDQAVQVLKFCKRMKLTVADVGRIPHSLTTYDPSGGRITPSSNSPSRRRQDSPQFKSSPLQESGRSGSRNQLINQMVDEKAGTLLRKTELDALNYYRNEYSGRQIDVDAFVSFVIDLLNTQEKYTLVTELRELVFPEDIKRFDELIYRQSDFYQRRAAEDISTFVDKPNTPADAYSWDRTNRDRRKASPIPNDNLVNGFHDHIPSPTTDYHHPPLSRGVGSLDPLPSRAVFQGNAFVSSPNSESSPYRRRNYPDAEIHDNFDFPADEDADEMTPLRRHHSMYEKRGSPMAQPTRRQGSPITMESQGVLRVRVRKVRPFLGIAIEGGANTKHPLPRIINIHVDGAAFEAGGLRVGQVILEVDGQKMEGLPHADVAKVIADAFGSKDRREMEFVVAEPKRSPMELRRSSLLLLQS